MALKRMSYFAFSFCFMVINHMTNLVVTNGQYFPSATKGKVSPSPRRKDRGGCERIAPLILQHGTRQR